MNKVGPILNGGLFGTLIIYILCNCYVFSKPSTASELKIHLEEASGYLLFPNNIANSKSLLLHTITQNQQPSSATEISPSSSPQFSITHERLEKLAVGVRVNQRTILASIFVKGKENGVDAIDFSRWLIPFDAIVRALRLQVTRQGDGQLEIRSPFRITRLDPEKLLPDPDLGQVVTIATLQDILGIEISFDVLEYAIQLRVPAKDHKPGSNAKLPPVLVDGLPKIKPASVSIGAIDQTIRTSGNPSQSNPLVGELRLTGHLLGGNWLVTLGQAAVTSLDRWFLANAQYFHLTPGHDVIIGSQTPFWHNPRAEDYWGVTTVHRHGFSTPDTVGIGLDARERLQASQFKRSLSGRAEPGTLVRLVNRFGDEVLEEVLVDSSGSFQFRNIPVDIELGHAYELQLYPEGLLTVDPILRDVTLSSVLGQVPAGQSAWLLSLGANRQMAEQDFLGAFHGLRGGGSLRWGVTNDATLGLTVAYDQTLYTEANLFYSASRFPLDASLTVLYSPEWNVLADLRFEPSQTFYVSLVGDRKSQRLNLDWQLSNHVSLRSRYTRIGEGTGTSSLFTEGRVRVGNRNRFAELTLGFDTHTGLQGRLRSRLGRLTLLQRINNTGLSSAVSYQLTTGFRQARQSLQFNYESRQPSTELTRLSWQYRSRSRSSDRRSLWDTELGYAFGTTGQGPFLSVSTGIIPGVRLQASYQGVSLFSEDARFNLELTSGYSRQTEEISGAREVETLLNEGGLILRPFLDGNGNGVQDPGEKSYVADLNLLLLNDQPLQFARPQQRRGAWRLTLEPGIYRIDIDPAGFPLHWQTTVDAYGVEVAAGGSTTLNIPLRPSYTLTGVVQDAGGQPLGGARVEAIAVDGTSGPVMSITNGAGVYYLERLRGQQYRLHINGHPADPATINLDHSERYFQTLNLRKP